VPLPPFVAIWEESEYPIPSTKSRDVSGNEPDIPVTLLTILSWPLIGA
jgi:hypothetical protein